ncbi:MAG: hypothetical protein ABEJ31_08015 [Haloarculaceae archaeon]
MESLEGAVPTGREFDRTALWALRLLGLVAAVAGLALWQVADDRGVVVPVALVLIGVDLAVVPAAVMKLTDPHWP